MTKRVLIVVTHLLGAGHLTRAAALARAFAKSGHSTTLVSGGMPSAVALSPDIEFVQLPPVQIHGTAFSALLDKEGRAITVEFSERRRAALIETLRRSRPDILITELFPFGRRVLTDEFMALLREAHGMGPRPRILSSIRDILVAPTKPERVAQAVSRIEEFYDAVLVHGDPALAKLDSSWPVDDRLRPFIRYTGYVDENPQPISPGHRRRIIVSGGSSAASLPLYRAAVAAARNVDDRPWHVLVGQGVRDDDFRALVQSAPSHVAIERARPDFRKRLVGAELSISQAGYNTCVDILRSGVKAILVPFEAGHETEQRLRAECLEKVGIGHLLSESELDEVSLANAVKTALSNPAPPLASIAMDGASRSVVIADELALARPAVHSAPIDWSAVDDAIHVARDSGRELAFWWRDDDAVADTPQLERLLRLAKNVDANIAIAAIPQRVQPALAHRLRQENMASILVHGWSHANHAAAGAKKAEFGADRNLATMAAEAASSLQQIRHVFGSQLVPVFVPPWNRIAPTLLPHLAAAGYVGLSTFRDRAARQPAPGLVQINTHLDPIDWHRTRSLGDVGALVATLAKAVLNRASGGVEVEPIGLLTHHLAHDESIWAFCETLSVFLARNGLHFGPVQRLFYDEKGNAVQI